MMKLSYQVMAADTCEQELCMSCTSSADLGCMIHDDRSRGYLRGLSPAFGFLFSCSYEELVPVLDYPQRKMAIFPNKLEFRFGGNH